MVARVRQVSVQDVRLDRNFGIDDRDRAYSARSTSTFSVEGVQSTVTHFRIYTDCPLMEPIIQPMQSHSPYDHGLKTKTAVIDKSEHRKHDLLCARFTNMPRPSTTTKSDNPTGKRKAVTIEISSDDDNDGMIDKLVSGKSTKKTVKKPEVKRPAITRKSTSGSATGFGGVCTWKDTSFRMILA
jgi:hypothetical protein